jgi:hypothetical protein
MLLEIEYICVLQNLISRMRLLRYLFPIFDDLLSLHDRSGLYEKCLSLKFIIYICI